MNHQDPCGRQGDDSRDDKFLQMAKQWFQHPILTTRILLLGNEEPNRVSFSDEKGLPLTRTSNYTTEDGAETTLKGVK